MSAPLERRELCSPRSSQPLRVLFVFSAQVSDSASLAVPTAYSFLEENLVFIEIRKVPRAGGYALAAVFHSILNIFFQKDAWLSCPLSPRPSPSAYTHTHTHARARTHGLENKDQGVQSLPAPPSRSHRASQDSALCCGGGSQHLPAIEQAWAAAPSLPQGLPRCQETECSRAWPLFLQTPSGKTHQVCRPASVVNIY